MSESQPQEPLLLNLYQRYLGNQDTVEFVAEVKKHYSAGTLQRVCEHSDRDMRRAAIFSLGFVGDYRVNQTVGRAMQDEDRVVRSLASTACRYVWNRDGGEDQHRQLANTIRLNAAEKYREAIKSATTLLDGMASIAEAWYQRGSAWFQLNEFSLASRDLHQTLEINPYHYVAAAAMGDANMRLNNPVVALDSFRRALRVNPDLEHVRSQIDELSDQVGDQ